MGGSLQPLLMNVISYLTLSNVGKLDGSRYCDSAGMRKYCDP